jgi:hypothetical protein
LGFVGFVGFMGFIWDLWDLFQKCTGFFRSDLPLDWIEVHLQGETEHGISRPDQALSEVHTVTCILWHRLLYWLS